MVDEPIGSSFADLNAAPIFRYRMIMADPPWRFENYSEAGEEKNAVAQYACMDLAEIKALRVGDLAHPDGAILWLWVTNPMLREGLATLDAWGFRFVTAGHWVKRTKTGKLAFGTGYALRCAGEPFLIGAVGRPDYAKDVRSVVEGPIREHSRKPDEAFEAAERLAVAGGPRIEVFGRQPRPGWDVFGNEADKFAGEAA